MKWGKIGLLFDPKILKKEKLSAALMPIAEVKSNTSGDIRVYFSPRDEKNRSEVHYFDFNIQHPQRITALSNEALFKHGNIGAFDDSGITLGSIVDTGNEKLLYYTGWNLLKNVPMNNSIGIAVYKNNVFQRLGDGPIMTRTLHEPYSCASPFVMKDGTKYKMWYASMDKWEQTPNGPKHYYNIKYAESDNGVDWERDGIIAIDYEAKDEYAFGRPFVLKENGVYKMWYAYRGEYYKIGYAESKDGKTWSRKDNQAGIAVSDVGWDSEMIEYPYIFDYGESRYMLYNGNGYGKTGIGLAKLNKKK